MRIGVVSTPEHCKVHLRRLSQEGYRVECLGGNPNTIPPGIDLVVLRTASCSHGASDTAFKWKREGQGELIVENGLSGILQALRELHPPETPLQGSTMKASRRAWPDKIPERELPDHKWSKVHTNARLKAAYHDALAALDDFSEKTLSSFESAYGLDKLPAMRTGGPDWAKELFHGKIKWANSKFRGKPRTFAMFLLMLLEKPTAKTMGSDAYQKLTGKLLDIRVFDACAWYLSPVVPMSYGETGRPQAAPPPEPEPVSVEPEAAAPIQGEARVSPEAVDSNTQAILEVMDDLSTFKKEWADLEKIGAGLESRIRVLEGFRNTQGPVGSEWEARIESRIKALEEGQAETLRQAQTGARQAVAEMREGLRGDIADAFDALAAEAQAASNPASNPLAALEQVKVALKAAGFTGSLTLTIE